MKKTFLTLLAIVSLVACTKMEVEYTSTDEIGFNIVSGKMTKSAVVGTTYHEGLNMYVFATTTDNTTGSANYINKGEFKYNKTSDDKKLWAGWNGSAHAPYYWPNVKKLYFAGISKSGNIASLSTEGSPAAISMDFSGNGTLTINGYEPGAGSTADGDNDLMWFSKTAEYGKGTDYVHVDMYHTCSWITIKVYGDNITKSWKLHNITINNIATKGNVTLSTNASSGTTNTPGAVWTLKNNGQYIYTDYINKPIVVFNSTEGEQLTDDARKFENIEDNTIIIPQTTTNMNITYSYVSPAGATITETVPVSLSLGNTSDPWLAGYHYTYTVKITASEILIQPDAKTWNDSAIGDIII